MKKFRYATALLALMFSLPCASGRTWKDLSGKFEIEAEFVSADSKQVVLKKTDGSTIKIALARLSVADAKFVAEAVHRGSHFPTSAGRLAAGGAALGFLAKQDLEKPSVPIPIDDRVVRASVEGLAMLGSGDLETYRKRIDTCYKFVSRHGRPVKFAAGGDPPPSTRAMAFALMFSVEHDLQINGGVGRNLSRELEAELLGKHVADGGWTLGGMAKANDTSGDGTAIALVALGAAEKLLGESDAANAAKRSGLEYLKTCVYTEPSKSGIVSETPGGNDHEPGTSQRSMTTANSLSLNGEEKSAEYVSIFSRLKKLSGNMVNKHLGNTISGHQKEVSHIQGEAFLCLMFHRASDADSADYWKDRLGELRKFQKADGSFAGPTGDEVLDADLVANLVGAVVDAKAAAVYREKVKNDHLPASIQTTAFRALTFTIPEGNLRIFSDSK